MRTQRIYNSGSFSECAGSPPFPFLLETFHEEVQLRKEFKDFSFDFTASDTVEKKNRISFVLGNSKGTVSIKELSLIAK